MKVFITGIAGFLGSHLADRLLSEGYEVHGIDNMIGGMRENIPARAHFRHADCNDRWYVRRLMEGMDVVYHLAASPHEGLSVFAPYEITRNGHLAAMSVLSAACDAKVKRLIMTSSMARYGEQPVVPFTEDMPCKPVDPYGIGKVASEQAIAIECDVHGIEWSIAVPHNAYGPRQLVDTYRNVVALMVNRMLRGEPPIIYGDGEQRRTFSYVEDVIGPLATMATHPGVVGEVINLGPDDEFISMNELAARLCEIMHFRLEPIYLPPRPQEVRDAHCSGAKGRRILGYVPAILLWQGLEWMVAWMRNRGPIFPHRHMPIEIHSDKTPEPWTATGRRM